jgi:tagatose-1,6-bisphosphate aldolase non-catalytic subunit AgaZ/GatZ
MESFARFVALLRQGLESRGLLAAWPCFIVGKVGTDLHTSFFDPQTAQRLTQVVMPLGSLIKGHYTDSVENPQEYPASGMGGANVGPEFTIEEARALADLCAKEDDLCRSRAGLQRSHFLERLEEAVVRSGRWQKWLQADEQGKAMNALSPARRRWLVETGARYIWTDADVLAARRQLYANLSVVLPDPDGYVVARIARVMDKYVQAFHLFDANTLLGQ